MMITTKRVSPPAEETPPGSNAGWIQSAVRRVAQTWMFRAILRQLDTLLWVVEKSAEWSLPQNQGESDESTKVDPVRPLPWLLFLPTLLFLRMIRVSLNVVALMLGYPGISPISIVRFVQKSRCRLANIGNTNRSPEKMEHKGDTQDKRLLMNRAKKALIRSIRLTLSTLSCLDGSKPSLSPPPIRIHAATAGGKSTTESAPASEDKQGEKVTPAIESDISSEAEEPPGRNHQLAPRSYDSHNVEIIDEAEERSCEEEEEGRAGRDAEDEATEESNVGEDESDEEKEDGDNDEESDDQEERKKHENGEGERGGGVEREEENGKAECDKAECDLMEQPGSSNTEDTSPEKTPALSQDSDTTHFYSPIESSASRSRSSSNSSASNDAAGQSEGNSSTSNTYLSIQDSRRRNTLKANECGNGEARFITEETTTTSGGKIDVTKSQCPLPTGRSYEETNNGTVVGKRGANAAKYHHHHYRGKRTSHGNRKKK